MHEPLPPHPSPDPEMRPHSDVDLGRQNLNPPGIGLLALIREDLATHDGDFFSQGFWALAVHRFGNWRIGIDNGLLRRLLSLVYRVMYKLVQWLCGIDLAYTVKVGRRVRIWHHGGMTLEALEIGDEVHIRQNVTFGLKRHGDPRWLKPVVGARCQIGAGAVIVGAIVVGANTTIGANVVLAQDVPSGSIVTMPKPVIRIRSGTSPGPGGSIQPQTATFFKQEQTFGHPGLPTGSNAAAAARTWPWE